MPQEMRCRWGRLSHAPERAPDEHAGLSFPFLSVDWLMCSLGGAGPFLQIRR